MPKFQIMPLQEAKIKSSTGQRAQRLGEYLGYIQQLQEGQAGRLQPAEGERVGMIRRRLGTAARLAEKELTIKRVGDEIYFWAEPLGRPRRRPGRSRKGTSPS